MNSPPTLIAVEQDLTVLSGRPASPCGGPPYYNYGTVVAVVYSKPVTQASAGATESYLVDGDNGANSVQIQPSGRVALLNLRKGISAIRPRTLTVTNVTDVRGNPLAGGIPTVQSVYSGHNRSLHRRSRGPRSRAEGRRLACRGSTGDAHDVRQCVWRAAAVSHGFAGSARS